MEYFLIEFLHVLNVTLSMSAAAAGALIDGGFLHCVVNLYTSCFAFVAKESRALHRRELCLYNMLGRGGERALNI